MAKDVKITYINNSWNRDKPVIFVFATNRVSRFDVLRHGVAWRTISRIGRKSSSCFFYPQKTYVQAMWGGCDKTGILEAVPGQRYTVLEDATGIVLAHTDRASQPNAIEVSNQVEVDGGIRAQILKGGSPLMVKKSVAYNQKATFILHSKLYWGIASEIEVGQSIESAVLNSDRFWVQDIENISEATVTLVGNAMEGYQFVTKTIF